MEATAGVASPIERLTFNTMARLAVWPKLSVIVSDLDTGEMVEVHESAAAIFGYRVDEMIGQQVEMVVPEAVKASHSLWRRDVGVPKNRLMGAGRPVHGVRKNGEVFLCHVGLTDMVSYDRQFGVAVITDLSGVMVKPSVVGEST